MYLVSKYVYIYKIVVLMLHWCEVLYPNMLFFNKNNKKK